MKHDDLFLLRSIFNSDDDGNPIEEIWTGYDKSLNLIVLLEHTDYDYPEYNCATYAVINKEDAFSLARRLKVNMTDLPDIIADSIDSQYLEIINPSLRQTKECFAEILECFADERCRIRLVRTCGAYGYSCF